MIGELVIYYVLALAFSLQLITLEHESSIINNIIYVMIISMCVAIVQYDS